MGTITQSRPQLCNDNEQERPAECLLGSVTSVRFIAPIHASTFHRAETEAATAFVVLNSGLELYADLIAREKERGEGRGGACLVINYNLQKMRNWAETLLHTVQLKIKEVRKNT